MGSSDDVLRTARIPRRSSCRQSVGPTACRSAWSVLLTNPLPSKISRYALSLLIGLGLAAVLAHGLQGQSCQANAIVCENLLTGNASSEWDVSGAGDSSLQGFATSISVNKGETVHFKVDTTYPTFQIDIYRLGYY